MWNSTFHLFRSSQELRRWVDPVFRGFVRPPVYLEVRGESVGSVSSPPAELVMMHNPAVLLDLLMTPPCWRSSNYSGPLSLSSSPISIWLEIFMKFSIDSSNDWYPTQNANLGEIANIWGPTIELCDEKKKWFDCDENQYLKSNNCFPQLGWWLQAL